MPDIYRTISGALFRAPNLEHNNRDHDPPTYYEKIEKDKKKHLSYEIIWQIGDMDDTGYDTDHLSAIWAEDVLLRFAEHLMYEVSNVTYVSKERFEDPEWKPPFEAGVVITNFAFNGDESTPHLHMTFVPYSDNRSRGQKTRNVLAQTFTRMGYKTTMECKDALIEIKKSDVAEWEEKAEYSKSEYLKADELLTDKKKEVEQAQGELSRVTEKLDEATRKKMIALDLYHRLSTYTENTDLFDKVVDFRRGILSK